LGPPQGEQKILDKKEVIDMGAAVGPRSSIGPDVLRSAVGTWEKTGWALLADLVNTDSPAVHKAGVDECGERMARFLCQFGFTAERQPHEVMGDRWLFRHGPPNGLEGHPILLQGHLDTVFEVGTSAVRPFRLEGERAYGPGVADMKGGVVVIGLALAALSDLGWCGLDLVEVLLTPDEEQGSPTSRAIIESRAARCRAAFVFEAGRSDGSIVIARKGSARYRLIVTGRRAHGGLEPEKGASAIKELAHQVLCCYAATEPVQDLAVNVAWFEGGGPGNIVADRAEARVHVGFWTQPDLVRWEDEIRASVTVPSVPGTTPELQGGVTFLPMAETAGVQQLYGLVQRAGQLVGVSVRGTRTRGAADAGFIGAQGVPVLCGLGPVGGNLHAETEYIEAHSLVERATLLAMSLLLTA
jgi:glutamate carboxypeptidase